MALIKCKECVALLLAAALLLPSALAGFQVPKEAKEVAQKYIGLRPSERSEQYALLSKIDKKHIDREKWTSHSVKKVIHFVFEHRKRYIIGACEGRKIEGARTIDFKVKTISPNWLDDEKLLSIIKEPYKGQVDADYLKKLPEDRFVKTLTVREEQGAWRVYENIALSNACNKAEELWKNGRLDEALALLNKQPSNSSTKWLIGEIKSCKLARDVKVYNVRVVQHPLLKGWLEVKMDVINKSKEPIKSIEGAITLLDEKGDKVSESHFSAFFHTRRTPMQALMNQSPLLRPGDEQQVSSSLCKEKLPKDWCRKVRVVIEKAEVAK